MKISSRHSMLHEAIKVMSVAIPVLMAGACTDNTFEDNISSQAEISFKVSTGDGWNSGRGDTRSVEKSAPAVITLKSGENPLYLVPFVEEGIVCSDTPSTRGSQLSSDNIYDFGVFASIFGTESGPDYMCNEEVTSASNWTTRHNYRWPGDGQLHINAYSPYVEEVASEGITSLPSPSDTGNLKIDFTVPSAVSDQVDLLWSDPQNASASPCEINFNHALIAVRFAAGKELGPCTVKEISIKGIADKATLDLETGEWSTPAGSASYSVSPEMALTAAEGSQYVAEGTAIVDGENTFLLMPQTLGADASVSVTLESNGSETTLVASLEGQEWVAGKTITYRLSASPDKETLELEVTGDFASTYTGGTDNFSVVSNYLHDGETTPVKWTAEFVDDEGHVIEQPGWITSMTLSGVGNTECEALTTVQDMFFEKISPQSQVLQDAGDINASSGFTPYNLASSTGQATVENTANTYIINAPGKYSIPLVYGNAIKNGVDNTAAYKATTHQTKALKTFENHLGNGITDPYIYNNSGCTPSEALLVWEDELNLVRNVALSSDGKCIEFDVPHNTIRQGNAVVAVKDADGDIMWSWQLWVTDYVRGSETVNVSVSGKTYGLYPRNVGRMEGGDVTNFPERSVKVRFTQIEVPDDLEPLQKTVEFTQSGIVRSTPDCDTYYQWGRKDPMMSELKEWYDASHKEITAILLNDLKGGLPSGNSYEQTMILTPDIFWESEHVFTFAHTNLWNMNLSATALVKTIYDPCPVGSMVPERNVFRAMIQNGTLQTTGGGTQSDKKIFNFTLSGGSLSFPALGYRSGTTGGIEYAGAIGEYWCCDPVNASEGAALRFDASNSSNPAVITQEPRSMGFVVRPMLEP